MNGENVEYELSLKDGLSPKVKEATEHVNRLSEGMSKLGERVAHVAEAFGISFAIFKGIEFIKEAKEEWEKLEFANSQLEAGLESTEHQAGLTFEELQNSALKFSHNLKFTQAQVEDMQSILLTFPSVTKDTFDTASQAVLDMATRLGTDAKGAAIQLGKALQDPVAGLNALHRVGVNTEELKKKFENVTGTLERQKLILKELNEEFGGSAQMAAAADVSFRYDKAMQEVSVTIGEIADKFMAVLAPALEWFADTLKATIQWIKEHKDLLSSLAIGITVAATAWGLYTLAVNGTAIATTIATAATAAWNAVLAVSPIGWILIGLGAIITTIVYCSKKFAEFRGFLMGVWETIKEFGRIVGDVFMGLGKIIEGVLTLSPKKVVEGYDQTVGAISNAGKRLGSAFKAGYDEGMADWQKDHQEKETLLPKGAPKAKSLGQGAAVKEPKTKATGSKTVTINVTIKDLINTYNSNVTNVKESMGSLKNIVVKTLTEAVNDFQIVGDH